MKITTENKILFKEVCSRHNLKEGFIATLFKKRLKSSLLKDKSLQKALADADKELDGLKKHVKDMEKKGMKIPAFLKPYR